MTALLGFLISNPIVLAIGVGIIGAVGAWMHGRVSGAAAERNKQAAAEVAAVNSAKQVQTQVDQLKPDDARKELGTWSKS